MFKSKFIIIKLKKKLLSLTILFFILFLLLFSDQNISASKAGLLLWANSVVPTLLPFFIATEILMNTNIVKILGKKINIIMKPIFNVPGEGAFPLIMGIITGYPVGAKIVSNLKEKGIVSDIESERLIAFTNNSGPLFILGTVGTVLFKSSKIGLLLLITHILASLTVGILFRWWKKNETIYEKKIYTKYINTKKTSLYNSKESLSISSAIMKSINTILLIGGFIVMFSIIISILQESKIIYILSFILNPILKIINIPQNFSFGIISGILEITNGISTISYIPIKQISKIIIISSFLLGFGGISIAMQVYAIISKSNISIKPYIIGKLLQGTIAAIYTYIFIYKFNFINLDI